MAHFDKDIIAMVKATGELYGRTVSDAAATMFLADLAGFTSDEMKSALSKCRKELRYFPTVADVISRIDDGRPGVEAAWAQLPKSENDSVVWTKEAAEAYGVCRGLIKEDPVAARMAFKEVYSKLLSDARTTGIRPQWQISLGLCFHGRIAALKLAVANRQITSSEAHALIPDESFDGQMKYLDDISNRTIPGRQNIAALAIMKTLPKD